MKRTLCILAALLLASLPMPAQTEYLAGLVKNGPVEFTYSFKAVGDTPLVGSGKVVYNQGKFKASGNGLDIWCDSLTIWTVDSKAKEVYIESAASAQNFLADPEGFLVNVKGLRINGNEASGQYTSPSDSRTYNFSIKGIRRPATTPSDWKFDTKGLDKSWIVTDLR